MRFFLAWLLIFQSTFAFGSTITNQAVNSPKMIERLFSSGPVTQVGDKKYLLETANNNILLNPSFEHSTVGTSWTFGSGAVGAVDTTNVDSGKQSVAITLTSVNGLVVSQDVTPTYQTQNKNIEHGLSVKTTASNLQVCPRQAGATITGAVCIPVLPTGLWTYYPNYYAGPASGSIGVSLITSTSTSGTVNVDTGYVGVARLGSGTAPNTYVVRINNSGTPTIATSQPQGPGTWVTSLVDNGPGDVTINISGFTSPPLCECTPYINSLYSCTKPVDETTSVVRFRTYRNTSSFTQAGDTADVDFSVTCHKTGADYLQSTITPNIPTAPTVQNFTSGTAQTYTTPPGVSHIRVRMVGGGGGGSGSGAVATPGTAATAGGNTTFGTTLLVANGGSFGIFNGAGGVGGTASLGTGPIGTVFSGGSGGGSAYADITSVRMSGGGGAASYFGGAGGGGRRETAGQSAVTNSGSGGGGGGTSSVSSDLVSGSGGGAGGYVEAIIASPSTTYTYTVGTAGAGGAASATGGAAGGAGAAGYIEVTEFYGAIPTPVLLGSVTSNANSALRTEYVVVETTCSASPCTIDRQSGSITNVTRLSAGTYCVNYPTSTWSGSPKCSFNTNRQHSSFYSWPSTASVCLQLQDASNTVADGGFHLECIGPR